MFYSILNVQLGLSGGSGIKKCTCKWRSHGCDPCVGEIPWRRKCRSPQVFTPGKSRGQRSLRGYSPWGCKGVGHDLATKQGHNKWIRVSQFIDNDPKKEKRSVEGCNDLTEMTLFFKMKLMSYNSPQCDILTLPKRWEQNLPISIYYILAVTIPKLFLSVKL